MITPGASFTFVATPENDRARLDTFITEQFPDYSRNFFKVLIEKGNLLVNNAVPSKSGYSLRTGDVMVITFPGALVRKEYNFDELTAMNIEILFKHEDFLIIHKPAGVLVHPTSEKNAILSLVDWLVGHFKDIQYVGYTNRPGIVHRLDKDTSGLMIVALNNTAHATFSDLFKARAIQKTYLAVVKGQPEKEGTIDFPIGRHTKMRNKMGNCMRGRASTTHFKVLTYFDEHSLVEVKPVTGRTHQIRVHFSVKDHPLIGDVLYGIPSKVIKRQALHAFSLAFEYKGQQYYFEKETPADFKKLLSVIEKTKTLIDFPE